MSQSTILLISSPLLLLLLLQLSSFSAEASSIINFPPHLHPISPASDFIIPAKAQRHHLPPTLHAEAPTATHIAFAPHNSNPLIPAPNSNVPPKPKSHHQLTTPHVKAPAPAAVIAFSPHNSHPLIPAPESIVPSMPPALSPHAHNQPSHHHHHHHHHHYHHHHLQPKNVVANSPSPTPSLPFNKGHAAHPNAFSPHNSHPLIQAPESIVPSEAPAHPLHAHNMHSHHHHHHLPPKNVVANSPSPTPSLPFNKGPAATPNAFSPHNSQPLIQAPESIVPSEAPTHPLHAHNTHSHHHHHLPPKNVVANSPSPTPSLPFNKGPAAPPNAFSPHNSDPLIQAPESSVPSEAPAHPLHAHNTHSHHHHHLPPKNVVANPPSPTPSFHFNKPNLPPFIPIPQPSPAPTSLDFKP